MRHYMTPTKFENWIVCWKPEFFFLQKLGKKVFNLFYYPVIMIHEILKEKCMFEKIQKKIQTYETVTTWLQKLQQEEDLEASSFT